MRWLGVLLMSTCGLAGSQLPPKCQQAVDAECAQDCYPNVRERPCDGPMIGLHDASSKQKGWKCYSPSTLDTKHEKYVGGTCYCSRDSQISSAMAGTPDCPAFAQPPKPIFNGSVPVFYPGLGGSKCFRIPTIIETSLGTLLAFAELRGDTCSDDGTHALVLRRSSDGGATWGPMLTVRKGTPPCAGCPAAISNPNPVEVTLGGSNAKAVLLHYDTMNNPTAAQHGLDYQIWSFDDGLTWTNNSVIAYPPVPNTGTMIGPSQGIQNANGTIYFVCHGSEDFLYWSNTQGRTWQAGTKFQGGNECSIAFLVNPSDGRIIMNCRTGKKNRAQLLWSPDGTMIGDISYPKGLIDPGCQGSIVNAGGQLYTSNAASTSGRENMVVKTSTDQGQTWAEHQAVWKGPSGYSQLVDMLHTGGDGGRSSAKIGLLFEAGREKYTETISFALIDA